jgi:hypothetical protein
MAIKPIVINNKASNDEVIVIGPSLSTFSAKFMKNHQLENMTSVQFLEDDEDVYWLGFKFFLEQGPTGSLAITRAADAATGRISSGGLVSNNRVLKAVASQDDKQSRTFPISFDKSNSCWFIRLRPAFERGCLYRDKSSIPSGATGIYRYFDKSDALLYIGKGVIRDRLDSNGRIDWGIHRIEYSILNDDQECLRWESYYIREYVDRFGIKPPFNRIAGHNQE